jgi:hypothetical protein
MLQIDILLLGRCLDDNDDEVRDRAALYLRILENQDSAKPYVDSGKLDCLIDVVRPFADEKRSIL